MADRLVVAHHYAVLIGINSYPKDPLEGCVRDVREIEQYLQQAVNPLSVRTFVAPLNTDLDVSSPLKDGEARPSSKNVTAALREIGQAAKAGDYVYIHFSGHGTRTETDPNDPYSNQSSGDLALVLLDEADDKNTNTITGRQFAEFYLNPMVLKGLVVTLVLDCCFSAGVYRRNGNRTRFLPYNADCVAFQPSSVELEEWDRLDADTRKMRNASMRLNWLMDPNGYAILSACGAEQVSGEIKVDGVAHGRLSYFLRQSFETPGGCRKTHAAIYRHIYAVYQSKTFKEHPILHGRKDQGFFGAVDVQSCRSFDVFETSAGELRLLAGRAHALCDDDRFMLYPVTRGAVTVIEAAGVSAKILHLGGLTSILGPTDVVADNGQRMWTASLLTQSAFRKYPIRLHDDLLENTGLKAALAERFLTVEESESSPNVLHIIPRDGQNLGIWNGQGRLLVDGTYSRAAEQIEHLVRFAMIRDLTNPDSPESFQKCFRTHIESGGNSFETNCSITVKHMEKVKVVLENTGSKPLFFCLYDLGPSWQVQNLLNATYQEVPASDDTRIPVRRHYTIRMRVPVVAGERQDSQKCEDYIKIFVTSQPSLFDSLELPELGQTEANNRHGRFDLPRVASVLEQPEQWASVKYHIVVTT